MRTFIMALGLICLSGLAVAQNEVYNEQGLITVEAGALLYIQGELHNELGTVANEGQIELLGDWTNQGTFTSNMAGEVIFSGTQDAYISGNMTGVNDFFHLIIQKDGLTANDRRVILNTDIDVDGVLNFQEGRIKTQLNEVFVTNADSAAIVGHDQPGIMLDDRYVEGNLRRKVDNTLSFYDFPVGEAPTALGYQLLKVKMNHLSTTTEMATYFMGTVSSPPNLLECGLSFACALDGHGEWMLSADQGNPRYDLRATPRKFALDCSSTAGSAFYTLATGASLIGDSCSYYFGAIDGSNGTEIYRNGLDQLGPIAIAGAEVSVLPVELLHFDGEAVGSNSLLTWSTANELNNDYFVLERSREGRDFVDLGQVQGGGNSSDIQQYRFVDENPFVGSNYYRLRQVDLDGTLSYSQIVQVRFDGHSEGGKIYPNPFASDIHLHYPSIEESAGLLQLFNPLGQQVYQHELFQSHSKLNLGGLSEGVYLYQVWIGGQIYDQGKLIKK